VTGQLNKPMTFQMTGNWQSFGLGPGSSVTFPMNCYTMITGQVNDTLTFTPSVGSAGSISLACNGINSTVLLAPSQVNFDATLVGRAPANKTVNVTGTPTATIDQVSLDSAAQTAGVSIISNPQGMTVGSGQSIVLAYSAEAMHAAGPLGTMQVK